MTVQEQWLELDAVAKAGVMPVDLVSAQLHAQIVEGVRPRGLQNVVAARTIVRRLVEQVPRAAG